MLVIDDDVLDQAKAIAVKFHAPFSRFPDLKWRNPLKL
jgi:hypothetical protein